MVSGLDERFLNDFVTSPVGVAVLAAAEARFRSDWFESPRDSDADAVQQAAADMSAMDGAAFLALTLEAAQVAGPWDPSACENLAAAYEHARQRRPIAEGIAGSLAAMSHANADLERQEWWHSNRTFDPPFDRKFVDFSRVYGNGEFPWDGLWTVTDPPDDTHDGLIDTWELHPGPISRWRLPARSDSRIWRIDRPGDWATLVERYPRLASRPHAGWELPGPNQHRGAIERLLAAPGQHAARDKVNRHVLPDWAAVRDDYDGVHLSWAGFMTTEGRVTELGDGSVTMLRYWGSERTLWLADVFEDPVPLSAPALSGRVNDDRGVSVRDDASRRARDLGVLTSLLGR